MVLIIFYVYSFYFLYVEKHAADQRKPPNQIGAVFLSPILTPGLLNVKFDLPLYSYILL